MSSTAEELYLRCVELAPARRSAVLDGLCGDDPDLRREVERMLALTDSDAVRFLQEPVVRERAWSVPDRIGRYRVLRVLGEGTSGTVFEGEQDRPRRRVAIKVLRAVCASEREAAAFSVEADILGRLNHPQIAKVYECGVFRSEVASQPFIAMELVEGEGLDAHVARAGRPDVERAVGIVLAVCDAVEHAHRHGVVHRDLKPANVLLTANGDIKLVDFGVARLTEPNDLMATMPALAGLCGTLPYVCPELASGSGQRVDGRADVYSLGVMLFELLAGRHPIELTGRTLPDSLQAIRDESPPALSSLCREARGDLETIVMCAIAKEPERRYRTAHDFSTDLRRLLACKPVAARQPSLLYSTRKFVRRNAAIVAISFAAVLALLAGTVVSSVYAVQASRRATESERRLQLARGSLELLFDDVITALPEYPGTAPLLERILDEGTGYYSRLADEVAGDFAERRTIWLSLERLANTRMRLGNRAGARTAAEQVRSMLADEPAGEPDGEHQHTLAFDRLRAEWLLCQLDGEHTSPAVEELSRRLEQRDDPEVLVFIGKRLTMSQLGTDSDEFRRADRLCQRALELAPDARSALELRSVLDDHLVNLLVSRGEIQRAREVQERGVELLLRLLDASHPTPMLHNNLCVSRSKLAMIMALQGDVDDALAVTEQAIAMARALVLWEPTWPIARSTLASTLAFAGGLVVGDDGGLANDRLLESCRLILRLERTRHNTSTLVRSLAMAIGCADSDERRAATRTIRERIEAEAADGRLVATGVVQAGESLIGRPLGDDARGCLQDLLRTVLADATDDELRTRGSEVGERLR